MNGPRRRVASLAALGGAVGALAVDVLYLTLVLQQRLPPPGTRVPFVAAWIAAAALLAGWGSLTVEPRRRAWLLGPSAAALVVLAFPAIFSIGTPLFVCAVSIAPGAIRAAVQLRAPARSLLAGLLLIPLAGCALALGFLLTRP